MFSELYISNKLCNEKNTKKYFSEFLWMQTQGLKPVQVCNCSDWHQKLVLNGFLQNQEKIEVNIFFLQKL